MSETEKGIQNPRSSAPDDRTPTKDAAARENQEVEQQTHEEQPNGSISVPIRTGFLSFLVIVPPIANTTHYNRRTKWMLTIIVALAALAAPLGSNILLRKWSTKSFLFSTPISDIICLTRENSGSCSHLGVLPRVAYSGQLVRRTICACCWHHPTVVVAYG